MGEDTSIDEFATRADGTDDEHTDDDTADDTDAEAEFDPDDLTRTVTVYGWTPRTAACATCGESVERRWRDDGAMVCRDCKEW